MNPHHWTGYAKKLGIQGELPPDWPVPKSPSREASPVGLTGNETPESKYKLSGSKKPEIAVLGMVIDRDSLYRYQQAAAVASNNAGLPGHYDVHEADDPYITSTGYQLDPKHTRVVVDGGWVENVVKGKVRDLTAFWQAYDRLEPNRHQILTGLIDLTSL